MVLFARRDCEGTVHSRQSSSHLRMWSRSYLEGNKEVSRFMVPLPFGIQNLCRSAFPLGFSFSHTTREQRQRTRDEGVGAALASRCAPAGQCRSGSRGCSARRRIRRAAATQAIPARVGQLLLQSAGVRRRRSAATVPATCLRRSLRSPVLWRPCVPRGRVLLRLRRRPPGESTFV